PLPSNPAIHLLAESPHLDRNSRETTRKQPTPSTIPTSPSTETQTCPAHPSPHDQLKHPPPGVAGKRKGKSGVDSMTNWCTHEQTSPIRSDQAANDASSRWL